VRKVAVVVVVVAVVGAAVLVAVRLQRHPTSVGYLGDSITDQARTPLVDDLDADPSLIKAISGIKIELMVGPAMELAAVHPSQVVINLGTNNVLAGSPVDGEVDGLIRLVDLFPDASCVHLVTINEHMIQQERDVNVGARQLNDRLHAVAAANPRVRIVDWAKIVDDYDAAGDPDGPITTDTVHPAPAGQKLLLDAYRASIASC
jgi:GDSL-like Lipase/Acylhydrolase family